MVKKHKDRQMKLTTDTIRRLIKEELSKLLREGDEQLAKQYVDNLIRQKRIGGLALKIVEYIKQDVKSTYQIDNIKEYITDYISDSDYNPGNIYDIDMIAQELISRQADPVVSRFFNMIYSKFPEDLQHDLKMTSGKKNVNREDWRNLLGNIPRDESRVEKDIAKKLIETKEDEIIDLILEMYLNKISKRAKKAGEYHKNMQNLDPWSDQAMLQGFEAYTAVIDLASFFRNGGGIFVDEEELSEKVREEFRQDDDLKDLIEEYDQIIQNDDGDVEYGGDLIKVLYENLPELIEELNVIYVFEFLYLATLTNPDGQNTLDPKIMKVVSSENLGFGSGLELWASTNPNIEELLELIEAHRKNLERSFEDEDSE